MGLVAGSPLGTNLRERGAMDEALEAVEAALVREFGSGPLEAPMQSISFSAHLS
jgi:hypothetical protein